MSDDATAAPRRPRPAGSVLLAGNLALLATGLVTAPFTARALGPDGRGTLVLVTLIASLIILFGSAGYGWMARDEVALRPERGPHWLRASRRLTWVVAPVAAIVGVAWAGMSSMAPSTAVAMVVLFFVAGFASMRAVAANVLIALGRPARVGLANSAYAVTTIVLVGSLFASGGLSVATAIWANSAGLVVQAIVLVLAVKSVVARMVDESAGAGVEPDIQRRARTYWRAQVSEALTLRSDSIVVAMSTTTTTLGLYSVAALLAQVGNAIFSTIIQMSFARRPKLNPDRRLALLFTLNLTGSVVFIACAWPALYFAIPWVFGSDFVGARAYLPAAAVFAIGTSVLLVIAQDAARRAAGGSVAYIAAASAVLGLGTAHLFGVTWGIATVGLMLLGSSSLYVRQRGVAVVNPLVAIRMLGPSTRADRSSAPDPQQESGADD